MAVILIRTLVLYVIVILVVRLMGKRQIGQLQPTELVVTILLSEVASMPLEDNDIPLINSVFSVLLLASLEIISSAIALKSGKYRRAVEGNAVFIIKEGKLDVKAIKKLRYSMDDLMESLRQKDIFDVSDVEYAVVETSGNLSVMLKADKIPLTLKSIGESAEEKGIPAVVISDGKYIYSNFSLCRTSKDKIDKILSGEKISVDRIMLMTLDKKGNKYIITRDG
ncbi:MAG: DUF421 domain-containing protein [Ruminococcaceae bacterium]|nr:DUF421 domain-containing protein [Oscillospiraceae bacterium]